MSRTNGHGKRQSPRKPAVMKHANRSHYFALGDGSAASSRSVVRAAKRREKQKLKSDRGRDE